MQNFRIIIRDIVSAALIIDYIYLNIKYRRGDIRSAFDGLCKGLKQMVDKWFSWLSGKIKENIEVKQVIYLDENDVKEIVAKHFNTDASNVRIKINNETRGCGPMEETVHTATCEIETNA